jgi:hypothetical protein
MFNNISKKIVLSSIVLPAFLSATPNAPENLVIKALSSSSVSLSWSDRSDDESGFKIYRDDELIKVVGTNVTTFVDSGLSKNTTYTYTVKATDNYSGRPSFSKGGGFYSLAQSITLSSPNGEDIYYTLDGKTPTTSSNKYTSAIRLNHTSVIKAAIFKNGKRKSDVVANSYIINFDTDLPLISLSLDSKYLYDDEVGIYVVGTNGAYMDGCGITDSGNKNYAQDWRRAIKVEYFNIDHKKDLSFEADLSITGECSRNNAKKEFKIELNSKYVTTSMRYKFFEHKGEQSVKEFKLTTGAKGYEIGDLITANLIYKGFLDVDYQADTPVQMFLNGEYWGIYNIRESSSKNYLKSNYPSLDIKNIDIVKVSKAIEGDMKDYNSLLNYLRADHSDSEKYDKILQNVDIDSFIDYVAIMAYSADKNWRINNTCWKSKDKNSPYAKWRWMIDENHMGYSYSLVEDNPFGDILSSTNHTLMSEIFKTLMKNSSFESDFKRKIRDLINITYKPENVLRVFESVVDRRKYEMSDSGKYNYPDEFNAHVEDVKNFIDRRNDFMIRGLESL